MQEQNFEKQVQEKMKELSFVPSAPVWEKVEKQIRNKREKRRIIFWLLPFILVSGLGWWLLNDQHKPASNNTSQVPAQNENNSQNRVIPIDKKQTEKEYSVTDKTIESHKQSTHTADNNIIKTINKSNYSGTKHTTKYNHIDTSKVGDYIAPGDLATSESGISDEHKFPTFNTIFIGFNGDSVLQSKSIAIIDLPSLINEPNQSQKTNEQGKWQLAFTAQGGISGISDGFGSFSNSADIAFDNLSYSSIGGGLSNAPSPPPSTPKASFAFSTGVDVKRKISNRLAVYSGIRYAYYSNTLKVGSTVYRDTSFARQDASYLRTAAYYRNDANYHSYTNKYHYIQLPFGIEYKLTKAFPINLQAGIIAEQLLSANALFYNYHAGVYLNDKDLLTKTGIQLFSGFNYHFRSRKAFSFAIGPQLQYGITNLSKNKDNNQHLYFVGISTQVFFLKK